MGRSISLSILGLVATAALSLGGYSPRQEPADSAPVPAGQDTPTRAELEAELGKLRSEREAWQVRELELLGRIDELELEQRRNERWREQRTREWMGFLQMVAELELPVEVEAPPFAQELVREIDEKRRQEEAASEEDSSASEPAPDPEARARALQLERGRIMRSQLETLLTAEHVFDIDVLELGLPRAGFTGPVVLRLLDQYGRPRGNLSADRLRLEASRAGRVVTLVLEEGRQLLDGRTTTFDGSGSASGSPSGSGEGKGRGDRVRRIDLLDVNPDPWLEALPELFDPTQVQVVRDDGRFDLARVRSELNVLLLGQEAGGHWRLAALGGVSEGVLLDVQLVQLDRPGGQAKRRLFADRLELQLEGDSLRLTLREGVHERRGRSVPFLEGRYLIVLPGVDSARWRSAGLPGLEPEPGER